MSKEMSFEEIQAQILGDFNKLLILTKHGTLGYMNLRASVDILITTYIAALKEERRGADNEY